MEKLRINNEKRMDLYSAFKTHDNLEKWKVWQICWLELEWRIEYWKIETRFWTIRF